MDINARYDALQACALFAKMPPADLRALAETMREEQFDVGQTVIAEGEAADRVFIVLSGHLDVRVAGAGTPAAELGAGDLFGEYGLFGRGVRTATVVSREAAVLLTLDYARFRAFLLMFPEAMLAILDSTVQRLLRLQSPAAGSPDDAPRQPVIEATE